MARVEFVAPTSKAWRDYLLSLPVERILDLSGFEVRISRRCPPDTIYFLTKPEPDPRLPD